MQGSARDWSSATSGEAKAAPHVRSAMSPASTAFIDVFRVGICETPDEALPAGSRGQDFGRSLVVPHDPLPWPALLLGPSTSRASAPQRECRSGSQRTGLCGRDTSAATA